MKSANSLKTSKRYFKEILTILKFVLPKVRIPNTFPTLLSKINSKHEKYEKYEKYET